MHHLANLHFIFSLSSTSTSIPTYPLPSSNLPPNHTLPATPSTTMYTTHPPPSITALELGLPPETHQVIRAATFLLIPAELLYFSVYFRIKNFDRLSGMLTTLSLAAFFFAPWLT